MDLLRRSPRNPLLRPKRKKSIPKAGRLRWHNPKPSVIPTIHSISYSSKRRNASATEMVLQPSTMKTRIALTWISRPFRSLVASIFLLPPRLTRQRLPTKSSSPYVTPLNLKVLLSKLKTRPSSRRTIAASKVRSTFRPRQSMLSSMQTLRALSIKSLVNSASPARTMMTTSKILDLKEETVETMTRMREISVKGAVRVSRIADSDATTRMRKDKRSLLRRKEERSRRTSLGRRSLVTWTPSQSLVAM